MAESITLAVDKLSEELELEPLTGSGGTVTFTSADIGRPGLQFMGYYDHFSSRRVQIIGMSEMCYLYGLSGAEVRARMKRFMSYGVPCIVCARGNMPPKELIESAREHGLPVFLSHQKTDDIGHRILSFPKACAQHAYTRRADGRFRRWHTDAGRKRPWQKRNRA